MRSRRRSRGSRPRSTSRASGRQATRNRSPPPAARASLRVLRIPALSGLSRDVRASLLIGLCCLLIYNANGRAISAGDAYPARYLPLAMWGHATLTLDPIESLVAQGRARLGTHPAPRGVAFWAVPAPSGHLVSLYPVVLPVLIAPLYLPAVGYLHARGWSDERVDRVARLMEKLVASSLAACSAALFYLLLRRRAAPPVALLLTAAYALGTTAWMIGSQALWQHGMAQLLLIGLLLLLTAPATLARALLAGLLCALVTGTRPANAVLSAALGVYGLFWAGRKAPAFAAGAAVPVGLVLFYNVTVVGAIGGAYATLGSITFFQHDIRSGLAGLLFSPTRGLLVFSPFLAFLALAWRHRPLDPGDRRLAIAILAGVAAQTSMYALTDWRAGVCFGPRFMTDMVPLLIWLLVPVVVAIRRIGRVVFVAAVAVAMAIEGIGAFTYDGYTDRAIFAGSGANPMRAAWQWRNAPFVAGLRQGVAPPELVLTRRGAIEAIEVEGRPVEIVPAGAEIAVSGWALIGRAAPLQIAVAIGGAPYVPTSTFTARPDIRRALPGAGPAGWRIPIQTTGLATGEHRLSVYVWGTEAGEAHLLTHRPITIGAAQARDDLEARFATAAARVRAHQQEPGFWLTAFTSGTRFEQPHPEMNTYVTSLLVDLLDPVAAASGLDASVRRARQHLTAQIEDGGLVRYHGLPTAPGIGTLGCAITPDTDDTALVWRIAPPPDRRPLAPALATIEAYRRDDGLYRTWLAPRDRFQCLDPGRDPNPADVAIQMHLLQLLAAERPPAGHALCTALRRDLGDDRIWVYYAQSPLVPILRLPDLERAGCQLELPASRLATTVAGQEIWVSIVRHLAGVAPTAAPGSDKGAIIEELLRQVARDDFALLRTSPPLLYHNDLTASVSRYYWSEDVGYALWLRLAYEHAHIGPSKPAG